MKACVPDADRLLRAGAGKLISPERTLYVVLGVQPTVTRPELERAYMEQKERQKSDSKTLWELERAYVTLSDPNSKRRYDSELHAANNKTDYREAPGRPSPPKAPAHSTNGAAGPKVSRGTVLALLLLLFAVGTWRITWPFVSWRFRQYAPGVELELNGSDKPLGRVVAFESNHEFTPGNVHDAYQIQLASQGLRWFTREEINKIAAPRR